MLVPKRYTITFDSDGGSSVEPVTDINAGNKLYGLTIPEKIGFDFLGWYIDDIEYNEESIMPNYDITLKAKWKSKIYIPNIIYVSPAVYGSSNRISFQVEFDKPACKYREGSRRYYTKTNLSDNTYSAFEQFGGYINNDYANPVTLEMTNNSGYNAVCYLLRFENEGDTAYYLSFDKPDNGKAPSTIYIGTTIFGNELVTWTSE